MDEKQFSALMSKLDALIKLQAITTLQGRTLKDQAVLLSSLGLQPKEIADILGKTPHHISVIMSDLRKATKSTTNEAMPAEVQKTE